MNKFKKLSNIQLKSCFLVSEFFSTTERDCNFVLFCLFSNVYKKLVEDGVIAPKPEKRPPTVPMDYNWAQVVYFLLSKSSIDVLSMTLKITADLFTSSYFGLEMYSERSGRSSLLVFKISFEIKVLKAKH